MRVAALFVLSVIVSGCMTVTISDGDHPGITTPWERCGDRPLASSTFYLGPRYALQREPAEAGVAAGNGFAEAFATNDMQEWRSEPQTEGLWLTGEVGFEYWARNVGTPAPIVDTSDPQEGYHFFNQFGSDRGFQSGYVVEYRDTAPAPDSVEQYNQTFTLPEGGFIIEPGDQLRLLLTSLVLNDQDGSGHEILFGGDHPSRIWFEARCFPHTGWNEVATVHDDISIPANQGLFLGDDAQEGVNQATMPFRLHDTADRLSIRLTQMGDANPVKDDIDLEIQTSDGESIMAIGSPYSDETGVLWRPNLDALMPPGDYQLVVNSYSGLAYQGEVEIIMEEAGGVLDEAEAP